jgi:hypothetical protein
VIYSKILKKKNKINKKKKKRKLGCRQPQGLAPFAGCTTCIQNVDFDLDPGYLMG